MRKYLSGAALVAIIAGAASATAAPLPVPNACVFAPVEQGADGQITHCEFDAADVPAHGYVGLVPNDFVIYEDANNNDVPDDGEILAEVSPLDEMGTTSIGQLALTAGTTYDVDLIQGCAEVACGWVGVLAVG